MKLAITSPLFVSNWNHRRYVQQMTQSLRSQHPWYFLPVANRLDEQFRADLYQFSQNPIETIEIEGRQPQAVAKAWNDGIRKAGELGCDYVLVLNDDLVLKSNAIDRLVEFAEAHQEAVLWSMGSHDNLETLETCPEDETFSEHPHFAAFMVKPTILSDVGLFDENLVPAYFEDSSYHAQIALANKKAYAYGGSRCFHFGSRTANEDEIFRDELGPQFRKNAQYFMQKWGFGTVNDVDEMRTTYYKHPYNIPELGLDVWIPDFWQFLEIRGATSIREVEKDTVLAYLAERGGR